jgi:hypothetical protein
MNQLITSQLRFSSKAKAPQHRGREREAAFCFRGVSELTANRKKLREKYANL